MKHERENRETLNATLLTAAATLSAENGNAQAAGNYLQKAKSEMARNDIRRSQTFTQWLYAAAMASFVDGDRKAGFAGYSEFLRSAQNTSFWLYQIAASDNAVKQGGVSDREAEVVYDLLLGEPVGFLQRRVGAHTPRWGHGVRTGRRRDPPESLRGRVGNRQRDVPREVASRRWM